MFYTVSRIFSHNFMVKAIMTICKISLHILEVSEAPLSLSILLWRTKHHLCFHQLFTSVKGCRWWGFQYEWPVSLSTYCDFSQNETYIKKIPTSLSFSDHQTDCLKLEVIFRVLLFPSSHSPLFFSWLKAMSSLRFNRGKTHFTFLKNPQLP